jgi:hypothetical protein
MAFTLAPFPLVPAFIFKMTIPTAMDTSNRHNAMLVAIAALVSTSHLLQLPSDVLL